MTTLQLYGRQSKLPMFHFRAPPNDLPLIRFLVSYTNLKYSSNSDSLHPQLFEDKDTLVVIVLSFCLLTKKTT
jgi:hypothetical protein